MAYQIRQYKVTCHSVPAGPKNPKVFTSIDDIMAATKLSRYVINRAINNLSRFGNHLQNDNGLSFQIEVQPLDRPSVIRVIPDWDNAQEEACEYGSYYECKRKHGFKHATFMRRLSETAVGELSALNIKDIFGRPWLLQPLVERQDSPFKNR